MPLPGEPDVWVLQLDPPAVSGGSRVMLDINNPSTGIQVGGTSSGTGIDWGVAQDTPTMAQEGEWGSSAADTRWDNRTVTIPLGLGMGGPGTPTADEALDNLRAKIGLLQREGGWLLRQRNGGPAMYADIADAQLDVPDVWAETGDIEPGVTLTLICIPDWYGDEIALDSIPCTGYCDAVLTSGGAQANIEGDYKTRCRIVVTDRSGNIQSNLSWGLRSRYYDNAATAALFYAASGLTALTGTAVTTVSGAYGGSAMQATIAANTTQAMVSTVLSSGAAMTHVGTYRVWARTRCNQTGGVGDVSLALWWAPATAASQPTKNTAAARDTTGDFVLVDLGVIVLPPVPIGSQGWWGNIVATNPTGESTTFDIDAVLLQPIDDLAGVITSTNDLPYDFLTGTETGPGSAVIYANETLEARHDGMWTQDVNDPSVYVPISSIGDLPRLPPSGVEARACQLFLKPSRGAASTLGVADSIDTFTVTPYYRPSFMFRP